MEILTKAYEGEGIDTTVINDKTGIDVIKLRRYIEIALILENRNKNHKFEPDKVTGAYPDYNMTRILYPMKLCTKEDFISRKYDVSEKFASKLKNRLCPDIEKDDPNYIIKNLYQNKDERLSFSF